MTQFVLQLMLCQLLVGQIADDPSLRRISPPGERLPAHRIDQLFLFNDADRIGKERIEFPTDTKFASAASGIFGLYQPNVMDHSSRSIRKAAESFVELLDENQKRRVVHDLDSQERHEWTNLPARPNAGGIRLGDLNDQQVKSFSELLAHLLSPTGYEKIRMIMLADDQLLNNNQPRPGFGTEYFSVVMFGNPSEDKLWAVQLDGHHVGLNVAVFRNQIAIAPSFIGTQPVKFELGGKTIEPMELEIQLAFELANQLTEEQFRTALVSDQRGQIQTGPGRDAFKLKKSGIRCDSLNQKQKSTLMSLIATWVSNLPKFQAQQRLLELESEINEMYFAWNGSRKSGSDVSFVIQSPTLIIEFAYQNLGGDPLNHLHTQYRNPKNDYGKGLFENNSRRK